MGRPPCCDKSNVKRGLWTPEEDAKILAYVSNHGTGNWTLVPKIAGLNRCGKSCRLRWTNYLRPDLKHDSFTPHEEELIINLHKVVGSRWSLIAKQLPGRTDNDVKNYWNTKLKKKLHKMGIDPVTHKSYSQILSDYGNISSLIFSSGNPFSNMMGFSAAEPSSVITGPSTSNNILSLEQPQFQFTNHDIVQPHFFNDVSSSCSSSSSSSTTFTQLNSPKSYSCQQSQPPITPSSPRLWSEFVVNDPALSADYQQDHESTGMVSSLTLAEKEISHDKFANEDFGSDAYRGTFNGNADISSWSATSFVDGILDKDIEMRSQFPQLLDSSFDY